MSRGIIIVNGRRFQEKKKWNDLSQVQKKWILSDAHCFYDAVTLETKQPLTKREKRRLLHTVFGKIRKKGIWIPFNEVGRVLSSRIRRWNRRFRKRQMKEMESVL